MRGYEVQTTRCIMHIHPIQRCIQEQLILCAWQMGYLQRGKEIKYSQPMRGPCCRSGKAVSRYM